MLEITGDPGVTVKPLARAATSPPVVSVTAIGPVGVLAGIVSRAVA